MAKTCGICYGSTGIKGFRCKDGILCRKCYQIVADPSSGTITGKELQELKIVYVKRVYQSELLKRKIRL